jgi:adenosine deaminase
VSANWRDFVRRLPKAELHCHLDGSLRPGTLLDLAQQAGVRLPYSDPEALARFMVARDAGSLEEYLQRFEITLAVMQTGAALERIAYELAEDCAREGVLYLETRFAPFLCTRGGLQLADVMTAVWRGLRRAEQEHGIVSRIVVCALRDRPPELAREMAELAVAFKHSGVVAFDLAGPERGHPASRHADAFRYARSHDLPCTCHAGEGAGADSVRDAVHSCCVQRIGHGTRLLEDQSLAAYVADRGLGVEVCLTSNIQTGAAPSLKTHPLREFVRHGLSVTLCTDNRLVSGTTLSDEYWLAAGRLGLTAVELGELALAGFRLAFLPLEERRQLLARAAALLGQLTSELGELDATAPA